MKKASNDVDAWVKALDPRMRELAQRLRAIIKKAPPNAVKTVKWGAPTYVVKGKNTVAIHDYKDHLNLEFFMGAKLKSKLLEGTGKGLRHIKIRTVDDIEKSEIEFTRLLKEAEKLVG